MYCGLADCVILGYIRLKKKKFFVVYKNSKVCKVYMSSDLDKSCFYKIKVYSEFFVLQELWSF